MPLRIKMLACAAFMAACLCALSACEDAGCHLGCDEQEGDCRDNPQAYDSFGRCSSRTGSALDACEADLCDSVRETCTEQCSEHPPARGAPLETVDAGCECLDRTPAARYQARLARASV